MDQTLDLKLRGFMSSSRRNFLQQAGMSGAGLWLSTSLNANEAFGSAQEQTIACRVVDAGTRLDLAARIRLLDAQGREIVPLEHPQTLSEEAQEGDVRFQRRRFAYIDGRFRIPSAALPLRYQVIKGYEYTIAEGEINAADVKDGRATIPLERWSSLARQGWRSGDIHIHHIAPQTCRLEMEAEDLGVANILTSDFTFDQERFEGKVNAHSTRDHLIYVNQEFRNDQLGHLCLLNLKQLIQPVKPMQNVHYPLHLKIYDQVHGQGGYVSWAHFPSWPAAECPLDVAMEKLDGLEILSVLEPRDFPIYMRKVIPEWEANDGLRLWYRYLNCGFRLTATAGTDKMTNYVTVGANRVFAQVEGEFNYQGWINALKAGRTFITNSPLLSLTVNGRGPGSQLFLNSKRNRVLEIHARADSQLPYHHLEIILNGQVIAEATPSGKRHHAEIRLEHPLRESCWIAARAVEDIKPYRDRKIGFSTVHNPEGTLHGNYYGTRRPETVFAHTTPVYITRDGQPIRSWDDAQYYIRFIDHVIQWLKTEARFDSPSDRQASVEAFLAGRAVYERRARDARVSYSNFHSMGNYGHIL